MVHLWLANGTTLGMTAQQHYTLPMATRLTSPVIGVFVDDLDDGPNLERLTVDGESIIFTEKSIPRSALKAGGWVSKYTPRWRVALAGLRDALRWGAVRQPKEQR